MKYPIEIDGQEFIADIAGTYYKAHAGSYWDPPTPPEVGDLEVNVNGKNMVGDLSQDDIENIVERFIEWNKEIEWHDEEEAWRMRNE
jgi:hypothetical protein